MILGNLYRQKGQVGARHQRPPGAAAAARPDARSSTPTCCSASASTSATPASSTGRSKRSRKWCGSTRATATRWSTCRSCTRTSSNGPRRPGVREQIAGIDAAHRPEDQQILGFLRNQIGTRPGARRRRRGGGAHVREAIDIDPRTAPAYLNLGDVREQQGNLPAAIEAWERLVERCPSAPTWPSSGWNAPTRTIGGAGALRRAVPAAHRPQSAGLAGPAGAVAAPWPAPGDHAAGLRRCCSRRCRTTRTD